jgi:hypothetical protein
MKLTTESGESAEEQRLGQGQQPAHRWVPNISGGTRWADRLSSCRAQRPRDDPDGRPYPVPGTYTGTLRS